MKNKVVEQKVFIGELFRYKTSLLRASHKKLMPVGRQIKGLKLTQAMDMVFLSKRGFSESLHKSLVCIYANLRNVRNVPINHLNNAVISYSKIEKALTFDHRRMKARGSASRSSKMICRMNLFIHVPQVSYLPKKDNEEQDK